MPLIWNDSDKLWAVYFCIIPWCITEIVRFCFYELTFLKPVFAHLRYNLFIVLYPIGVSGELACCYYAYHAC